MKLNRTEIVKRFEQLLMILESSRNEEQDSKVKKLYDVHIISTKELIHQLDGAGNYQEKIKEYYERESHGYGWSFLPDANGDRAEKEFWTLMKNLGYFKG